MIKTAARNIQIISPIRPKPFAVRLIALPKSASFAQELIEKYRGLVETDVTAAPFIFLDMFGKELAQEREQYYKMMLTLRLMIAHKLVVSGKLGDPTVSGAYMSSVNVLIAGALNYFRNSSNIIYNKLTDARRIIGSTEHYVTDASAVAPPESEPLTAETLIYSFSEGEERYYRELLEKTVSETIFSNIGSYPADTETLILRRYDRTSATDTEAIKTQAAENTVPVSTVIREDGETPVLTHRTAPREPEHETPALSVQERPVTVVVREDAAHRRDSAISRIMAGEGEKFVPLMNTVISGGSGYFADIAGKYIHRRTLPAAVIRPLMETVRRKKPRETFPLVVKALDILTAPDKANSQERAVYEYAVSTVWLRRMMPGQPEPAGMFSRLDRKERTDALVLAVNRLIKVSGKEAGKTIKYPDGKNRKRELSPAESALIWAIARDEHGNIAEELSGSIKNNVILNRLEKLYSAPARTDEKRHSAVIDGIERALNTKIFLPGAPASEAISVMYGDRVSQTYESFTVLSTLLSAGKEGAAAAMTVLPGIINTERTVYSELSVLSPSMTLRKPHKDSEKTFYGEFFEKLVSRSITLGEVGAIGKELSKERPSAGVITKRVESVLKNIELSRDGVSTERPDYGTSDITLYSRITEKLRSIPEAVPGLSETLRSAPEKLRIINEHLNVITENKTAALPSRRSDAAGSPVSAAVTETYTTVPTSGEPVVFLETEKSDIPASVMKIYKEITERAVNVGAVPDKSRSGTPGNTDITITRRTVNTVADSPRDNVGTLSSENITVLAETLMLRDDKKAKSVGETLMKMLISENAQSAAETSAPGKTAAPVFRAEADAKGALRTVAKLIGSLKVSEKTEITTASDIPAPETLYNIITQRPAGYIGGTFRRPPAGNIRTLAKVLSVPSQLSAASAERRADTAETTPAPESAQLNYRSTAHAAQQPQSSGGHAPTTDELVEQFGNLIEGIDPTKPMSPVRIIDGVTVGGSDLDDTIEKLRQTSEKTENNTKLIEELTKKQQEIEKTLKRSSDIANISEEVIKQLRIQLRFDSSRFMS